MTLQQYLQDAPAKGLTIISVCFRSTKLLRQNLALVRHLNPDTPIYWLVVQNTPEPERSTELQEDDPDFYVIPGPPSLSTERDTINYGSLHHAKALNIALAYTITRDLLIIDPDCFIVLPHWIKRVYSFMKKESLVFWGTPYHPERLDEFNILGRTYDYFPTGICLFINRRKLHQEKHFELDFTPPVRGRLSQIAYRKEISEICEEKAGLWERTRALWKAHGWRAWVDAWRLTCKRWAWDPRYDIGHGIYTRYRQTMQFGYTAIYYPRRIPVFFKVFKWLIPQSLTAYPKRRGYWLQTPFPFLPCPAQKRWEQFFHRGAPFAFHIGKVTYDSVSEDSSTLDLVLQNLLQTPVPAEKGTTAS